MSVDERNGLSKDSEDLVSKGPSALKLSGLTQQYKLQENADAAARRALNALSVTTNMVSALISNPGSGADIQETVLSAKEMLNQADRVTHLLADELKVKSISWAPYRLMKIASSAVAERWKTSSKAGKPTASVVDFIPVWTEVARYQLPEMVLQNPAEDHNIALRISLLEAMQPIMNVINIFDMFHDPMHAVKHARDMILVTAQRSMLSFNKEQMTDSSKSLLLQSLLRNAGNIYANCWQKESEDLIDRLQKMTPVEQTAVIERYSNRAPLSRVDESFEQSFIKLIEMVQFLSVSKDPTLQSNPTPDQYTS